MSFEVVDGLDFAVGGDTLGDGLAVSARGANLYLRTAERQDRHQDHRCQNDTDGDDPARFPAQSGSAALS
jgi:hypothetical protein